MSKLIFENVSKTYLGSNGALTVLNKFNFTVEEGEFICVVGPSGCGKTTLLNVVAGLDKDFTGRVLYDDKLIEQVKKDRVVIFQELSLFPWLSVQKNVEFGLKVKGLGKKEREKIAFNYLKMVKLENFRNSYVHELSGGMKQRVALARALAIDPAILLMDEPFTALDAQTRDMLHVELQRIWKETGKTIIFVTHNVREAVCLADKVIVLSASPACIKSTKVINLPRPRHIENPGIIEIVREILEGLKVDIERVQKEELSEK